MCFKRVLRFLLCVGLLGLASCAAQRDTDPVAQAKAANQSRFLNDQQMQRAASFLVEMTDARMMDAKEGQLASTRGMAIDVKAYGMKMVGEQAMLLGEIRALASAQGIVLPQEISQEKADGFRGLEAKSGEELDSKFVEMITIDHRRDVKEFQKAAKFDNAAVGAFARRRLPTIEAHLQEIEEITSRTK